ncbi:MAG TPA: nucleotidyltransferase family protein [Acidimicrobiia bacterium]|nr:nucleotidyltransferase family protein [Acidimicrobiia bacterium]
MIDLAADRVVSGTIDDAVVDQAVEHRVAGMLWTRVSAGEITPAQPVMQRLENLDLQAWARARMLESSLQQLLDVADATGVRVALIKGLATGGRWYARPTERWSYDFDLVVHPDDLGGIDQFVSRLYPSHLLVGEIERLVRGRHLQSVDLGVAGMPVDLHLDPLKLEIVWSVSPARYWDHAVELNLSDGLRVPTFDTNASLFLHLMHLNKDHFRRLIGYADVVRGAAQTDLDWSVVMDLAAGEGLSEHVANTASAVEEELGVEFSLPRAHRSWRSSVWARSWPRQSRLSGVARNVHRHRLFVIPLTAKGRAVSAVGGWLRRLWPPKVLLDYYYPHDSGGYLVKLLKVRFGGRRSHVSSLSHEDDAAPRFPR